MDVVITKLNSMQGGRPLASLPIEGKEELHLAAPTALLCWRLIDACNAMPWTCASWAASLLDAELNSNMADTDEQRRTTLCALRSWVWIGDTTAIGTLLAAISQASVSSMLSCRQTPLPLFPQCLRCPCILYHRATRNLSVAVKALLSDSLSNERLVHQLMCLCSTAGWSRLQGHKGCPECSSLERCPGKERGQRGTAGRHLGPPGRRHPPRHAC